MPQMNSQDQRVKRAVRTQVLYSFGDVAVALNADYSRYLEVNMRWLTEAIAAAQVTNPVRFCSVDLYCVFPPVPYFPISPFE